MTPGAGWAGAKAANQSGGTGGLYKTIPEDLWDQSDQVDSGEFSPGGTLGQGMYAIWGSKGFKTSRNTLQAGPALDS